MLIRQEADAQGRGARDEVLGRERPKNDSYLWDGKHGWKLEASRDDVRLSVRLGKPLGELGANRLDALRETLGEACFNNLSGFQTELELGFWGSHLQAEETRDKLLAAGFGANVTTRRDYQIIREVGGRRTALIMEDEEHRERVVRRMLEAGVPVVSRKNAK